MASGKQEVDGPKSNDDWLEYQPRCGIGCCDITRSPKVVNIRAFTAITSALIFLEIGLYSYMFGVIRTLEKRFGLRSGESNLLSSIHDAFFTVLVVVIGLFAKKAAKPRLVGGMMIFAVCGAFLFASLHAVSSLSKIPPDQIPNSHHFNLSSVVLPHRNHLVRQAVAHLGNLNDFCDTIPVSGEENTQRRCSLDEEAKLQENKVAYALMLLSCALQGAGASALFLGVVYINENSPNEDSALYMGITSSMYAFGSIFGYSMAAICTRLPEDLTGYIQGSVPPGDPDDPRWIGCWWLGFLIMGCLVLLFLVPMLLFPKHLQYYYKSTGKSPLRKRKQTTARNQICAEMKALPKAILRLFRKPVYLPLVAMAVCQLYIAPGLLMNIARYLEIHFGLSAYMANIFAAVCVALSEGVGTVVGGYVIRRFRLKPRGASRMVVAVILIGAIATCTLLSFRCPQPIMAGSLLGDGNGLDPAMSCNDHCSCNRDNFKPMCSSENIAFFSPCHAGCVYLGNGSLAGCACVDSSVGLTKGLCNAYCSAYIPYLSVFMVGSFIGSLGTVPALTILFGIVDEDEKSLAMGLQSAAFNLLSFVPGPILFGSLIDSTCQLWEKSCDQTGSCLLYDLSSFRLLMHGVTAVFQVAALVLSILVLVLIQKYVRPTQKIDRDKHTDANENTELHTLDSSKL